ncbi:MAG: MOSC N-terminal beta barrel domain-containing protein [Pyrinomonadaceae bacterium]
MHLTEINIYPVKSLKGIALDSSVVEQRGLRHDRRWMLVDKANKFMTQRDHPKMASITIELRGSVVVARSGKSTIEFGYEPDNGRSAMVEVWSSKVKASIYDDTVGRWFSDTLRIDCDLAAMNTESRRPVNADFAVHSGEDAVSFADGYPFLLIGEGSLADLNSRLDVVLPMDRFRPNFVVAGSGPFEEDKWKRIRIGTTEFHIVKPCGRCVITTVDQSTGNVDGPEPLRTLASYRKQDGMVMFGQNLIAEDHGAEVRIGDSFEILAWQ